eukprot:TRINITY_DN4998_c0_g1_i3.p2 TRINITY_DN4998_c0_g1~~TRINITY_DN4998_c0_g1_i3.p2  ORF type:complete len:108 (-),score=27.53 TRINITY_DN4998_c0_g1_i3:171-494(-)
MIRRPPRSTQGVSSAASDVYKRQDRFFPPYNTTDRLGLCHFLRCIADFYHKMTIIHYFYVEKLIDDSKDEMDTKAKTKIVKSTLMTCLLYTSPSPRDLSTSRMPSSA